MCIRDSKIPVVATKGTASWIDEEGAYTESDDSFGQVSIGAYKLGTMIKVSEELLNDSVFDLESYISREFARRIGAKEEDVYKRQGFEVWMKEQLLSISAGRNTKCS